MSRLKDQIFTSLMLLATLCTLAACTSKPEERIPVVTSTSTAVHLASPTSTSGSTYASSATPTFVLIPGPVSTIMPSPTIAPTPTFEKSYWMVRMAGVAEYSWIRDTRDNGILLIGGYDVNNDRHMITKLDQDGRVVWEKVFDPDTFLIANVDEDKNDHIQLIGIRDLERDPPHFIEMEFDEKGNIVSQKRFNTIIPLGIRLEHSHGASSYLPIDFTFRLSGFADDEQMRIRLIKETEDGGIITAGGSWARRTASDGGFTTRLVSIWIVKFDQEGKLLWQRYFRDQVGYTLNVIAMADGGVSFIGQDYTDGPIIWIAKFDRHGEIEFWRSYGFSTLYSVSATPEGGFILVGIRSAMKLDPSGDIIWVKTFMVHGMTLHMYEREQGGYILSGIFTKQGIDYDFVAFLNEDAELPDCTHLFTRESSTVEYFPPAWIDHSLDLRVIPWVYPREEVEDTSIDFNESIRSSTEMCRYIISEALVSTDPTQDPRLTFIPILVDITGIILGGFQDGIWLDAEETSARIKGGEEYSIFYEDASLRDQVTGSRAELNEQGKCKGLLSVELDYDSNGQGVEFAIGGTWDVMPRVPDRIPYDSQIYIPEITKYLRANGLSHPEISYPKMYQIDLDDDGIDEVIISAYFKSEDSPFIKAEDYSIVFLRKVIGNDVVTLPLVEEINTQDRPGVYPKRYSILNIFDLNGDGRMEVIVEEDDWANGKMWVFELGDETVEPVLSIDCMLSFPWWRSNP